MPNMSYCRFQNTLNDLRDCFDAIECGEATDSELSADERSARNRMLELCGQMAEYEGRDFATIGKVNEDDDTGDCTMDTIITIEKFALDGKRYFYHRKGDVEFYVQDDPCKGESQSIDVHEYFIARGIALASGALKLEEPQ